MNKILKGAVVLLIAIAMVFSTVAIADTNDKETLQTWASNPIKPSSIVNPNQGNNRENIIWHNGEPTATSNLLSSQYDDCYPFVSQVADDFHFEEDTPIYDVHWWGGFWGGDPIECIDFWIYFYADDGSGTSPTGAGMEDPSSTALAAYFFQDLCGELDPNGFYEYDVILDEPFMAYAGEKYWIAIQGVFCYPPQYGWANTEGIQLAPAVQGFPFLGTAFWTVLDPEVDMAFYLTGEEQCEPSIDVEKEVWDEKNGVWVDADTQDEAFEAKICTEIQFRITVTNTGNCPLFNVIVHDMMHKSLKYLGADPPAHEEWEDDEWYFMEWYIPEMDQTQTEVIFVNAHVEGPECSYDVNRVKVDGECMHGTPVSDEDECWIHAHDKAKEFNSPILNFLENHPNMFPLLQLLLQRLGLF